MKHVRMVNMVLSYLEQHEDVIGVWHVAKGAKGAKVEDER